MGNRARSGLNLWAQLFLEIPRLAAADLSLVTLVSSFVFSAAGQVLSSVRSFCVLPSNYSVYVYVSPKRPFVYRKNRRESSYSLQERRTICAGHGIEIVTQHVKKINSSGGKELLFLMVACLLGRGKNFS